VIGRSPDTLLKELLDHVIEANASDLHLSVGRPPIIRVDGLLRGITEVPPIGKGDMDAMLKAVLSEDALKGFQGDPHEIDLSYQHPNGFRFRVNVFVSLGTPAIALRAIPSDIRTLETLNLPPDVEKFTQASQGFVLITGPTGHGKTTTMAALVDIVNHTQTGHIITIEDPVEYVFREDKCLIHQREVHRDTESFAQALKMALREDPNVVMVGEMRDLESISTALTIAETGHLVFATLHTNDAAQTIDRVVDVFPPGQQQQIRIQLAATLTGIVSQRLLPKEGGGRIPAVEVLTATSAVRNLIREGDTAQIPGVIQTSAAAGMIPLERSLQSLVDRHLVSVENASPWLRDPALLGESFDVEETRVRKR
jgi:twitching motility protein PilT